MDPLVESWGDILRPQALDLVLLTGFIALALVGFFRKSVRLKYATLAVVVNPAAGRGTSARSVSMEEIGRVIDETMGGIRLIVAKLGERHAGT